MSIYHAGKLIAGAGKNGKDGIGLSIGDVVFSYSSYATDNPGKLPLFTGETVASSGYPDFVAWLNEHPELQCTATEYENSLTTYGECAKFVVNTYNIRLPLIKNYIKAANTTDGVKNIEAGLPNITGSFGANATTQLGAFYGDAGQGYNLNNGSGRTALDASRSSAVYGKSSTVTPASTTLYPWIVAFNSAVPASVAQAAEFQQALSNKVDTNLANLASNIDYVIESYKDDNGNWYRKYKSGWLEQGGTLTSAGWTTVTYLKAFADNSYTLVGGAEDGDANLAIQIIGMHNKTTTSCQFVNTCNGAVFTHPYSFYACGYGAYNNNNNIGNYYLFGAFNNWTLNDDYKFSYNQFNGKYYLNNISITTSWMKVVKVEDSEINETYGPLNDGQTIGYNQTIVLQEGNSGNFYYNGSATIINEIVFDTQTLEFYIG